MRSESVYVAMAEAETFVRERPTVGLNDPEVASLRAFRAYHKDARVGYVGGKWVTKLQARIHAVADRQASSGEPTTIRDIAREVLASPSTVSRTLEKFQAWGLFAVDVRRGKYGGVTIFRVVGRQFASYAKAARDRIRERIRKAFNVASTQTKNLRRSLGFSTGAPSTYGRNIKPPVRPDWLIEEVLDALGEA